jgi:hypothetical protein
MTTTNKGFNLGFAYEQGISFSENTGSFPMPEARTGVFLLLDANDQPHVIVLDHRDGKFYDITTRDGPSTTGMVRQIKDKVDVSGTGGTDIAPEVRFKEERGTTEKFYLNHLLTKAFVRPDDEDDRDAVGRDDRGYLDNIEFQTKLFVDGEPTTAYATAKDIGIEGDIVYDRKARGHRLQTVLSANKGGFKVAGIQNYYKVEDSPVALDSKITTEGDHQESLSSPLMWFSRRSLYLNRVIGSKASGSPVATTGADGGTSSAFTLDSAKTMGSIASTAAKTVMLWVSGASGNVSATIGGTPVTFLNYSGISTWYLNYASGVTASGSVILAPATSTAITDFSIHTGDKSDDLEYYFNDVYQNNGNNVMPI